MAAATVAAAIGTAHAGFSLYWAAGGSWLLATLGARIVDAFEDARWLLAAVGVFKLCAAIMPVVFVWRGWPLRRITRGVCWLGCVALVGWGGLNTIVGNLVLAGVIDQGENFDRMGMIGHAWLWDPAFLAWGLALGVALAGQCCPDR